MRTIYALWVRELIRYFRSPAQIAAALGQPLLIFAVLGLGLQPVFSESGRGSYLDFLAPGVACMAVLFHAALAGMSLVWDRQLGFLKVALASPAPRSYIMIGRTLGGATVAMIQGILVLIACVIGGVRLVSFPLALLALLTLLLIGIVFCALGTAIGTRLQNAQSFPLITNFLLVPIFFLSGALFPLEGLPRPLQALASANPLSYGVVSLRAMLSGSVNLGTSLDVAVLAALAVMFLGLATYSFLRIQL